MEDEIVNMLNQELRLELVATINECNRRIARSTELLSTTDYIDNTAKITHYKAQAEKCRNLYNTTRDSMFSLETSIADCFACDLERESKERKEVIKSAQASIKKATTTLDVAQRRLNKLTEKGE